MTLGQRIQELRKQAGLSQEALGEALGVSRQAVSKWESDGGIPELDTLIAMSRLFGITVGQLLGVETPEKQEETAEPHPGFTEEQVEDILRRYVEESCPPRETPASWLAKWGWVPAAAIVAMTVIVVLFVRVSSLRSTVRMLQSDVSSLESRVSNSLNNLSGSIRDTIHSVLEEENDPVSSFDWELESFDDTAKMVDIELAVSLKEWSPGTQARFVVDWTSTDQTEGQSSTEWVDGPEFEAELTLPMNYRSEVTLLLKDADGTIREQTLDTIHGGMSEEDFYMACYNLMGVFSISSGRMVTAVREDPYIDIYSSHPELLWAKKAHLTAAVGEKEILSQDLMLVRSEEDLGLWKGYSDPKYTEVTLGREEKLVITLTVTDNLGREYQYQESCYVTEEGVQGEAMAMPVRPDV